MPRIWFTGNVREVPGAAVVNFFSPPSGLATGSFNGLHTKSKFLAMAAPGVEVIHQPAQLQSLPGLDGRVFIIGGSEIYAAFLPDTDELLVSHVFAEHAGDTFFPEFEQEFTQSELLERHADFEIRSWKRSRPA